MTPQTDDLTPLDEKLRALPAIEPPPEVQRRALAGAPTAQARALSLGPRAVLFLTVLVYLGWAFRTASLLGQ